MITRENIHDAYVSHQRANQAKDGIRGLSGLGGFDDVIMRLQGIIDLDKHYHQQLYKKIMNTLPPSLTEYLGEGSILLVKDAEINATLVLVNQARVPLVYEIDTGKLYYSWMGHGRIPFNHFLKNMLPVYISPSEELEDESD